MWVAHRIMRARKPLHHVKVQSHCGALEQPALAWSINWCPMNPLLRTCVFDARNSVDSVLLSVELVYCVACRQLLILIFCFDALTLIRIVFCYRILQIALELLPKIATILHGPRWLRNQYRTAVGCGAYLPKRISMSIAVSDLLEKTWILNMSRIFCHAYSSD